MTVGFLGQRPTATLTRVDMSTSSGRASAAGRGRRTTERGLIYGYRNAGRKPEAGTVLTRPCMCGGWVVALRPDIEAIATAMRAHQATADHVAWREAEGL